MLWLEKADRLINTQSSVRETLAEAWQFWGICSGDALPVNRNSKGTCSVAWPLTSTHVRFTRAQQRFKISSKGDEGGVQRVALSKSSTEWESA